LFTGHIRLDLALPLSKGNVIMLKGERNLGKTSLAMNTISQFLLENENNRAIYVGLSKKNSVQGFDKLKGEL
jgi:F0F1-type ATP synthase alpha subunit